MDRIILPHASHQTNQSLHHTRVTLLIYSIWQQVRSRILPNTKLWRLNKVSDTGASLVRFSLPMYFVVPTLGYAVTTLAKFSTAPNALHYKSLKHLAIYLHQTQDWGIVYWRMEPVVSLPEVPCTPMTFDDSLPVIPPPAHLPQLTTHVDAAHANKLRQHRSTTGCGCCLAGGVVAYRSRTQSICAQSSTEAELIAANAAAKVTKYL